ncbi:fibrous sheath CABYR-binding protein-like isoform X2 [Seriola aureovittata]|uniref:fibrous sheath CABYR-binding protein-like isoform X2 n=1 Tax=Seriola aureovittata TaxID=2871759 RepID=UPI0024BE8C44|nr:fibrous sheath CABYR-binding protein-like isoform X2 [Seriola aureovittata]
MARRYFLACCILTSYLVSGQTLTYHLQGETIHLKPHITGHPDNILWKHNGNKVVEFDGKEEEVYSQFQNRVTLDWVSAELNLTDVRYDDSGEYELEIFINKALKKIHYKLEVIGKVPKPTVSCDMNNGSLNTDGTQATLTCSADPQSLMSYEWDSQGIKLPGPKLTISLGDEHDDKMYTCTVRNRLTIETTTFTAKDCYSEESSSIALPVGLSCAFLVLLLVLLICGVIFCKQSSKACFAERNKDSTVKRFTPGTREESDMESARNDIRIPLIRESTRRSSQRLPHQNQSDGNIKPDAHVSNHKEDLEEGEEHDMDILKGHVQHYKMMFEQKEKNTDKVKRALVPVPTTRDQDNPPGNHKGDAEADQFRGPSENKIPECDSSDTGEANEPEPVGVLDDSEDTQPDVESSPAPEHPGLEENTDKDKKAVPPPTPPKKPSFRRNPDNVPGNHKGDAEADQFRGPSENKIPECDSSDTGEANEPEPVGVLDDSEDTQPDVESSPAPEHPGLEENTDKDKKAVPPPTPPKKPSFRRNPDNVPGNHKGDAEADQFRGPSENKIPECDSSDTGEANEPEPVGVLDDSEDTQPDVESSLAPEHPGLEENTDKDKKAVLPPHPPKKPSRCPSLNSPLRNDQGHAETGQFRGPAENKIPECDSSETGPDPVDTPSAVESSTAPEHPESEKEEAKSPPADGISRPTPRPRSFLIRNSPEMGTKDTAGEHKEDAKSEPVDGETSEKNVRESDSPGSE